MNYQQSPRYKIDTSQPLIGWLDAISVESPKRPTPLELSSSLPLWQQGPIDDEDWYRKAWWGFHSARVLFNYVIRKRQQEIVNLVHCPDSELLDSFIQRGDGVIIAGSHLGPELAVLPWLTSQYHQPLAVTSTKLRSGDHVVHVGDDDNEQKFSLARALLTLRRKKLVRIVPDGEYGINEESFKVRINGQRAYLSRGPAELAYLSKAPTLISSFTWASPTQINARFQYLDMDRFEGLDKEAWIKHWYQIYLSIIWKNLISQPQDIGFRQGGLFWNKKRWQ
jgi:hypothetical protein